MVKGALLCSYCQREITSNPWWELHRVSKKLMILGSRQTFCFHNRSEVIAYLQQGKKMQQAPEEEA